ncbi:GGDEF domain-containing protein [Paenibacillus sp. 1011MAR3C5]|uniref:GGDEF domain-containing protein n=1 Tax=Paenibacillus sp. 1011MAR3C5 TaxID=1675787 RepID=UPI000E6C294D|nr:diguanylate cyclase [Paenibacillus sp. 1011MAR3C5]RJE89959.1 GGDEF domain-containing protein [Paenibacillus sp. 1011MAR3C5]
MTLLDTIEDIVANLAIVTAYLFFTNQLILKNIELGEKASSIMIWKVGFAAGLLGILLMSFTVHMNGTLLDFRQLALIIAAMYGGIYSSLIAAVMILAMRLFAFGEVTISTVIAASNTILIALAVGAVCYQAFSYRKKWIYSIVICNVCTAFVFIINVGEQAVFPIASFVVMMTIGGLLTAYLVDFLNKANVQFKRNEKEATVDFLTGLSNNRSFDTKYQTLLQTAAAKGECLSIALIDIDFFKKVNDTYGHVNGDVVLKQMGMILRETARAFDTVSRNGGEEFSVLLYDTPHEHALGIAEKMRQAVSKHLFELTDGTSLKVTVSIGVATFPYTSREQLMEQADEALYKAKANGRNQVCSNQKVAVLRP